MNNHTAGLVRARHESRGPLWTWVILSHKSIFGLREKHIFLLQINCRGARTVRVAPEGSQESLCLFFWCASLFPPSSLSIIGSQICKLLLHAHHILTHVYLLWKHAFLHQYFHIFFNFKFLNVLVLFFLQALICLSQPVCPPSSTFTVFLCKWKITGRDRVIIHSEGKPWATICLAQCDTLVALASSAAVCGCCLSTGAGTHHFGRRCTAFQAPVLNVSDDHAGHTTKGGCFQLSGDVLNTT